MYYSYYQHDTREDYQMPPANPYRHQQQHNMRMPMVHYQPVPYYAHHTPLYGFQQQQQQPQGHNQYQTANRSTDSQLETQPQMLSFKQYLLTVNQNLTPEQANKRYNDYRNNFRKQQIQVFFDKHKNEDW
jgi:hypothetical protein